MTIQKADLPGSAPHRPLRQMMKLPRSSLASNYRRTVSELAARSLPSIAAYLPQQLWAWLKSYLQYVFKRKHRFLTYAGTTDRGIYPLSGNEDPTEIRISIAGDWGTGTNESSQIARWMSSFEPDFTVHLGDVYYVGGRREVLEKCFGQSYSGYAGVQWPMGRRGSFALNSNHEMYANGIGYFGVLIPRLGMRSPVATPQLTSYFCLQNDHWRIIAIDTGYNSTGIPILGMIPPFRWIPGVGPTCKLPESLLRWLQHDVDPVGEVRATILLSHHTYVSAFEATYPQPAQQLQPLFAGQEVIWLWGHEHRFATYGLSDGPVRAFGRCVGHGGMPIEITDPHRDASQLEFWDKRKYTRVDGTDVGFNGFVNITLRDRTAQFEYRDLNNKLLLQESFMGSGKRITRQLQHVGDLARGPACAPST